MTNRFIVVGVPTLLILLGCGGTEPPARGGSCPPAAAMGIYKDYERARAISLKNDKVLSLMTDAEKEAAKAGLPPAPPFTSSDETTREMGEAIVRACTKEKPNWKHTRYDVQYAFVGEKCPVRFEHAIVTNLDPKGKVQSTETVFFYEIRSNEFASKVDVVQYRYKQRGDTEIVDGKTLDSTYKDGHVYSKSLGTVKLKEKTIFNRTDGVEVSTQQVLNMGTCKTTITSDGRNPTKITIDGTPFDL